MPDSVSSASSPLDFVLVFGHPIYALAIAALGIETVVCAHTSVFLYPLPAHPRFPAISVLPWLPPIPWLAYSFGIVMALLGFGLLPRRTLRPSALALGSLLFLAALILDVPRNAALPGSIGLRTLVFEPLSLACIAWLLPGADQIPAGLERLARYLLAISFIIFGVDHFLALRPIAALIPGWIPWHVFWIAFFGAGFIATGISLASNILVRWSTACIGLMYMIWVLTLHLPSVLGTYVMAGRNNHVSLMSSFLIAVSLWGGPWALARSVRQTALTSSPSAPS
ncbi:MAG TPA: hypothetical protein VGR81_05050 [Candidatus Acidoferrales bacterium]|nr:hypothetical protein [Candidatus Acidoferrales bacterium]